MRCYFFPPLLWPFSRECTSEWSSSAGQNARERGQKTLKLDRAPAVRAGQPEPETVTNENFTGLCRRRLASIPFPLEMKRADVDNDAEARERAHPTHILKGKGGFLIMISSISLGLSLKRALSRRWMTTWVHLISVQREVEQGFCRWKPYHLPFLWI